LSFLEFTASDRQRFVIAQPIKYVSFITFLETSD
jgi:hypothetical protein